MYAYFKIHVLVYVHVLLHRLTRIMFTEHFHNLFTVKKHSIVKSIHIRPMTLEISVSTLGKGGREGGRGKKREGGREGEREGRENITLANIGQYLTFANTCTIQYIIHMY